jgi:hypothetical protein
MRTFEVIPNVKRDGGKLSIVAGSDAEAKEIIRKLEERAKRERKRLMQPRYRASCDASALIPCRFCTDRRSLASAA